jgi:hypothetical protein
LNGASTLRLVLRPSPALAALVAGGHLGAGGCLALVVPGWPGLALAVLVTGLGIATAWDRALLRGRQSARAVQLQGDGRGHVECADGARIPVSGGNGRAGRTWVILDLPRRSRRHLLVTGDMLDGATFRYLRLWARWGRLPAVAARAA